MGSACFKSEQPDQQLQDVNNEVKSTTSSYHFPPKYDVLQSITHCVDLLPNERPTISNSPEALKKSSALPPIPQIMIDLENPLFVDTFMTTSDENDKEHHSMHFKPTRRGSVELETSQNPSNAANNNNENDNNNNDEVDVDSPTLNDNVHYGSIAKHVKPIKRRNSLAAMAAIATEDTTPSHHQQQEQEKDQQHHHEEHHHHQHEQNKARRRSSTVQNNTLNTQGDIIHSSRGGSGKKQAPPCHSISISADKKYIACSFGDFSTKIFRFEEDVAADIFSSANDNKKEEEQHASGSGGMLPTVSNSNYESGMIAFHTEDSTWSMAANASSAKPFHPSQQASQQKTQQNQNQHTLTQEEITKRIHPKEALHFEDSSSVVTLAFSPVDAKYLLSATSRTQIVLRKIISDVEKNKSNNDNNNNNNDNNNEIINYSNPFSAFSDSSLKSKMLEKFACLEKNRRGGTENASVIAWSPDQSMFLTSEEFHIRIFEIVENSNKNNNNNEQKQEQEQETEEENNISVVELCSEESGAPISDCHNAPVRGLSFSSDAKMFVSVAADRTWATFQFDSISSSSSQSTKHVVKLYHGMLQVAVPRSVQFSSVDPTLFTIGTSSNVLVTRRIQARSSVGLEHMKNEKATGVILGANYATEISEVQFAPKNAKGFETIVFTGSNESSDHFVHCRGVIRCFCLAHQIQLTCPVTLPSKILSMTTTCVSSNNEKLQDKNDVLVMISLQDSTVFGLRFIIKL